MLLRSQRRLKMYAVGRVGNFVSQGLYTVSGPFHPFGGAVDIIVVKQEDGTYKSSPWYVKFGKFQGVLKRSEKVVDVAVNDEAVKFHMYLDATGEAYFLKDAESDKEESSASHSLAISSGDEVSAVKPDSTKSEDGLENKATDEEAEKGEDSDEKDRNLALRFEGRKASYLLVQQAAEEAKIEPVRSENGVAKAEDSDSKSSTKEPSSELLASLAALRLKNGSVAELENATGGSAIHAFINQAAGLDKSQKPGRPSASLVAQAALASVARAATQECGPQVEEMSRAQSEIPEVITSRDEGAETVNGESKRDNSAEESGAGLEDRCGHSIQVVRDGREVIAEGFQLETSESPHDRGGQTAEDRSRVKRARSESDLRLYESGDTSPEVSTLMITSADGVVVLHTPRRGSPPPLPLQEEQRQHCAEQNTRSIRHDHETETTRNVETQTSVSKEEVQSISDASVTEADSPRECNGVVVSEGPGVSRSASASRVSENDGKNKIGDLGDVNNATIVSRTAVHFPTNVGEVDHGLADVLQTEETAVGGAEQTMKSAKLGEGREEFVESNGTFLKEDGSPSAGRLQEVEGSIGWEKKAQSGEQNSGAVERMEGPGNLSDTARSVELISSPKLKVAVERELAWRDAVHMASAALKVAPLSANRRRPSRHLERKASSGDAKVSPKRKSSSDRVATEEHAKIPDENAEKRSWGWWGWRGSTPSRPTSELGDKKDMKEFKESAEESNAEEQKSHSVIENHVSDGKDSGDAVEEVDMGSKVVQKGEKTHEVKGDVREAGSLEHAGEELERCYEDSGAGNWRSNDDDAMKQEVVDVKSKASNGKVSEKKGMDEQTTPKVGQRTGTENDLTSSRRRSILGLMFRGYDKDQISGASDAQLSEPTIHEKGGSEAGDLVEGKDSENEYHPAISEEISQGESEKLGALEESQPHEETVHEDSVGETTSGAPKIVEAEGVTLVSRDALVNAAEGKANGSESLDIPRLESVNSSSSGLSSESASSLHIESAPSESSDMTVGGNLADGESKKKADYSLEKNRLPFTRIGGDYGMDISAASSDSIFESPSADLKDSSSAFQGEEEVGGYDDSCSEIDIHMLPTCSPASSAVESLPEGKKEVSFALSLCDNSARSLDEKVCGDEIHSSDIPGSKGEPSSNSDSDGDGPSEEVVIMNANGILLSIPADSVDDRKRVAIADKEEVMHEQVWEDGQLRGVVVDSSRSVEHARSPSGTKVPTSPQIKDFLDELRNKVDSESEENVEVDGDEGADDSGSEDQAEQYLSEKRRSASSKSIYFDANTSDDDEEDRQGNVSGEEEGGSKWARSSPMSIPGVRGDSNAIYLDVENGSAVWPLSESLPLDRTKFTDVEAVKSNLSRSVGSDPLPNVQSSASPKLASEDFSKSSVETSQRQVIENDAGVSEQLENELSEEEHVESDEEDKLHKTGIELSLCKHLLKERMGSEEAQKAFNSAKICLADFRVNGASIVTNDKLVVRVGGQYYPWTAASPVVLGMLAFGQVTSQEIQGAIQVEKPDPSPSSKDVGALVTTGSGGWKLWPFPLRRPKTPERSGSAPLVSREALLVAAGAGVDSALMNNLVSQNDYYLRSRKHKVRSFLPTSQMLASMNLKEGSNRITFTFCTRVLGRQQVDARIYLWKWDTRVVISDVDGTITKSDVLGQVMPLVGKDWTQLGVTRLFSAIKENGYEVMFLSARAISQAYLTRQFLFNLKQDGEALPDGPVVISPDGLFPSLYREVIRRAPHEFKIACLQDIRDLFPKDCNPFYAGFGNRDTDEISYLKVGIPKGKIFIINPKGEVAVNNRVDVKSYTSLHKLVDDMFPPQTYTEQEDYNTWNYWKMPLPDVEDELTVKSGSKPKKTKS